MKKQTTKVVIKPERVEVIKQVRLTTNQRLTIIKLNQDGGRGYVDWKTQTELTSLGLLEQRDAHTESEKRVIRKTILDLWKQLLSHARKRELKEVQSLTYRIEGETSKLTKKTSWLTKAADEYLLRGTVTITR